MKRTITVGTRTSRLALWQSHYVVTCLQQAWPGLHCILTNFITKGDKTLDKPLPEIGGKGLFTFELERALLKGDIDIAVHSLKDLPVADAPGLKLGAVAGRADARDCLFARDGWLLETLPRGSVVGTSSVRRKSQLLAARSDLIVRSIRGNVETRMRKVEEGAYDATILAAAGVLRLGLAESMSEWLDPRVMLPAPGQGALAVQCRANDEETLRLLVAIDDASARLTTSAERAFLEQLGGGCATPIAAYALDISDQSGTPRFHMDAVVGAEDGSEILRVSGSDVDPLTLAADLAREAQRRGASALLAGSIASNAPTPLAGCRIVVTRASEQSTRFSEMLRAKGAISIEVPAIRITPVQDMTQLDGAIDAIGEYQWLVFTSANAACVFLDRVSHLGISTEVLAKVGIAAVGTATAGALRERGLQVDFWPERFIGVEIADGLQEISGARILLPRAETAGRALVDVLHSRGALVDEIPIYRTDPVAIQHDVVKALEKGVDAVTFTSGSTARSFISSVLSHGGFDGLLENACLACIGPVTAGVVTDLGYKADIVAAEQTTDGLVRALVQYFSGGRQ